MHTAAAARLELQCCAKVNLTLDVLDRRPEDGYHYIRTIMVPISLSDRLVLEPTPDGITLESDPAVTGRVEENLAYRAGVLLQRATGYRGGARIALRKAIPVAGGLAGGSTDAAGVLVGLNRLWGTGLSDEELVRLALQLGSDVPFFVHSRPARVEGIGERITPIRLAEPLWLVIATPDVAKSTGRVYALFDQLPSVSPRPDTAAMEQALATGDLPGVAQRLCNVFEQVMLPRHPEIARLKEAMLAGGASGALMSGAGPTVLGLVPDEAAGAVLLERIRPLARAAWLVRTPPSAACASDRC
ncbi:4-(cytidine 5'-diphospho)-2-C-methyl-D-erythritol kinase [Symbiobacterium terraclitae]|uniref:4-(cytidine 5'-diphospho)-2-C-methyl-D-erythritol kinase n=1 Tax=Symbiobacterium terraclitae TaxID=557451 RepID=UPI0035B4FB8A